MLNQYVVVFPAELKINGKRIRLRRNRRCHVHQRQAYKIILTLSHQFAHFHIFSFPHCNWYIKLAYPLHPL